MSRSEDQGALSANDYWQGELDLDRPCDAVSPDDTCWLCDDFTAWSSVMHAIGLELYEAKPRSLGLRFLERWTELDRDSVSIARQQSCLASMLLCRHPCIVALNVACSIRCEPDVEQSSFPIHLRPQSSTCASRSLTLLNIKKCSSALLHLRDMDAIVDLEVLVLCSDGLGPYPAAEVDALMERNRSTLKYVDIFDFRGRSHGLRMVETLDACEVLKFRSNSVGGMPDIDRMVTLMSASTALKEITIDPVLEREVSVLARALTLHPSLTKLSLCVLTARSIEILFTALRLNNVLKELLLYGGGVSLCTSGIQVMANALEENACLQTLDINSVGLDRGVRVAQLAEALSKNRTLQMLRINCFGMDMIQVSRLVKSLRFNRSLKITISPYVMGTEAERTCLARQLLEDKCYDRVQPGPWTETYLRILSPVLASPQEGVNELWLWDIARMSHESVDVLFNSLASSKKVRRLIVAVTQEPDQRVAFLCEMLKKNRSINYLKINIANGKSAREILGALAVNTAIAELEVTIGEAAVEESTEAFSSMLSQNNAITRISTSIGRCDSRPFMHAFARGMSGNRLVVNLEFMLPGDAYFPPGVYGSMQRNRAVLHHAVDFVLECREDRHHAECFDLFFGRACLLASLVRIGGISDLEARLAVSAAENRRREKYLILTGVVRRCLVCWPADVTQIDELNLDCWQAITKYLKVSDVRSD